MIIDYSREHPHIADKAPARQEGVVLVYFVLLIPVIFGIATMAVDVGYWYLVKAELSKSVDAAALAAARNVGNPNVVLSDLITTIGLENFPKKNLGAAALPVFTGTQDAANHLYSVKGTVTPPRWFGYWFTPPTISQTAKVKMKKIEAVLILDRSGSMAGTDLTNLKTAATSFVNNFTNTQAYDELGLISFSTVATPDATLNNNTVTTIKNKISNLTANGWTNADDAMSAAASQPFTASTDPNFSEISQFVIFFTDGQPNTFSATFLWKGVPYPQLAENTNNCADTDGGATNSTNPTVVDLVTTSGGTSTLPPNIPTGDGILNSTCYTGTGTKKDPYVYSVRWDIFADTSMGIANYGISGTPTLCRKTSTSLSFLPDYVCHVSRDSAIAFAQGMKNKGIKIYSIGLGLGTDKTASQFIAAVASPVSPGHTYVYLPATSAELQGVFNKIAQDVLLRLVQ